MANFLRWTYDEHAGDRYWAEIGGAWLPSGGFVTDIPTDNVDAAISTINNLQSNCF